MHGEHHDGVATQARFGAGGVPDLLIEVPHGATRARHFDALADALEGEVPESLREFFFVNTDVGAPELAEAVARRRVEAGASDAVEVIRCLVPRTFIDCNRVIDPESAPRASAAGEVTPGLAPYVDDPRDRRLLLERYAAYQALVRARVDAVCAAGGHVVMLHTYAPRTVEVPVDGEIVRRLREAYAPGRADTWPLRPEIDLIVRTPDGEVPASRTMLEGVRDGFEDAGYEVGESRTYPLHPSTMAYVHAVRHPDRTLCVEVRRDLLVEAFVPFAPMRGEPSKVGRIADLLAPALA